MKTKTWPKPLSCGGTVRERAWNYLGAYDRNQLVTIWYKIMDHLRKQDGYQPYGWDWNTLSITHPDIYRTLKQIQKALD